MAFNKRARTLILCLDGTGDQYDSDNSNVVNLCTLFKKDNAEEQMVYYQTGVGTYTQPGLLGLISGTIAKAIDLAVAWWLEAHILGGYHFLMTNYRPGDKICLFGFSRGAYTCRALAGMLNKVGLLPKDMSEQAAFAYDIYRRAGAEESKAYKATFCRDVEIEFMGVWDTVSSAGILFPRHLPFTGKNSIIKVFRHAISLDERRARFTANVWNYTPQDYREMEKDKEAQKHRDYQYKKPKKKKQDILEVYFLGNHCDVGGGNEKNGTLHSLSNITLRWMIREIARAQCGILFDQHALKRMGIPRSCFHLSNAFQKFTPVDKAYGSMDGSTLCPCGSQDGENVNRGHRRRSTLCDYKFSDTPPLPDYGFDNGIVAEPDHWTMSPGLEQPSSPPPPPLRLGDETAHMTMFQKDSGPGLFDSAWQKLWHMRIGLTAPKASMMDEHDLADHYRMTSEELDEEDAILGEMHNELVRAPLWWILEFLPIKRSWRKDGVWYHSYWPNIFRPRHFPNADPNFLPNIHHTVLLRRQILGYEPAMDLSRGFHVIE